jgi:hypothetical protein
VTPSIDPSASLRRIAFRAALLALPLLALGLGAPRLVRLLRPVAPPRPAERLAGIPPIPGEAGGEEPPPKPPESPTPEQIEKAREAQVALGRAQKGWESVTVITPRAARVGEDGLETLPFEGFGLSVDSAPAGARVFAGADELGETPLLASVACAPGSDVKVRVEKPPLPAWERTVRCRADTLVKLSAKLAR